MVPLILASLAFSTGGVVMLGETLTMAQFVGIGLVLTGLVAINAA